MILLNFNSNRLTPAYFIVIGLYATWLPKLGSGPLWNSRMTEEQNRCLSSWWLNLLYINNYVGTDQLVSLFFFFFQIKVVVKFRLQYEIFI